MPRLLNAYRHGIFPWYSEGQPILWWCPDPRAMFATDGLHLSSRFRRQLRRSHWRVRADVDFAAVIAACAEAPRPGQGGTWITADMQQAYVDLHRAGFAHSIEVFDGPRRVGGLYGVALGQMFFGESMFSAESGASKLALAALAATLHGWGWPWLDAQIENDHTLSLGCQRVPRDRFLAIVATQTAQPGRPGPWTDAFGERDAAEFA